MVSFNEIGLIPTALSTIKSRSEVNPYIDDKKTLPIFVAPMTCILNEGNMFDFSKAGVIPILPVRAKSFEKRKYALCLDLYWVSVTLNEFKNLDLPKELNYRILIDVANGHMSDLYESVKKVKQEYPNMQVMIGNIANPDTYIECCKAGVDYVRVGIGGGSACTTSVQTGMHASLPWLLTEINKIRQEIRDAHNKRPYYGREEFMNFTTETKVIADGGINSISKAIKALALGADYVMMGRCFAQCDESCAETKSHPFLNAKKRKYYGQSSEQGQIDRFGEVKSNPEGNETWLIGTGSIKDFTNLFEAALRSSMSYAGAKTLNEFHPEWKLMTLSEFNSYIK